MNALMIPTQPSGARLHPSAALIGSSALPGGKERPMARLPQPTDNVTTRTHEDLLLLGLATFRDVVDQYPDLPSAKRRDVLRAVAGFLGDLRKIGATR